MIFSSKPVGKEWQFFLKSWLILLRDAIRFYLSHATNSSRVVGSD
jgi:hypothetical protein